MFAVDTSCGLFFWVLLGHSFNNEIGRWKCLKRLLHIYLIQAYEFDTLSPESSFYWFFYQNIFIIYVMYDVSHPYYRIQLPHTPGWKKRNICKKSDMGGGWHNDKLLHLPFIFQPYVSFISHCFQNLPLQSLYSHFRDTKWNFVTECRIQLTGTK